MDILEQIDELVAYSADAKSIKEQIEACKQSESYALVEGDLSYNRGDYALEKQYNSSVNYNRQRIRELEAQLDNVNKNVSQARNNLKRLTEKVSYNEIHYSADKVRLKINQLTNYVNGIKEKLKVAYTKGEKAYNMGDFKAEREFNQEYRRYYSEITNLEPIIECYKESLAYLNCREMTINETEQGLGG
ncbi:MAG: hypothetical protein IJX17_03280 [Clostridia bacterium]|nr:hypothetical protein [Clostridia bacterium]